MSSAALRKLRSDLGDLVAQHKAAKDITEFSGYADDPTGFLRDVLRCDPWEKQVEMSELVRDNRRVVVVTANGLGKDWATARIALWWVYARKGFVVLTGPTERQVKQILMKEVRRAFARAPELPGELYSLELRVGGGEDVGILAFTSDNADKLTGFHHPRLLIAMTEGQGVDEDAYEAAMACATSPENRLFVYGNPTRPTGPFYRAAHSDNWHRLTIAATEHPNVVTGREEIPGAVSQAFVDDLAAEYGRESSIYSSRVLARFPEDAIEGLIKRPWIRAAVARWESGELEGKAQRFPVRLALDISRFGLDETVLAVVQGPLVRELITWRGLSITDTVDRTIGEAQRVWQENVERLRGAPAAHEAQPIVFIDEPGMGGGAIDYMRTKPWPVQPFNGSRKAFDPRKHANYRAQTHWAVRDLLEAGDVALPPDSQLEEEALAVEWQVNPAGQIQILGKDTIRSTLGRSPDRLDSVVIGLSQTVGGCWSGFQQMKFYQ